MSNDTTIAQRIVFYVWSIIDMETDTAVVVSTILTIWIFSVMPALVALLFVDSFIISLVLIIFAVAFALDIIRSS